MVMRATLSLLGLYNYDPSIFDSFTLPANMEEPQKSRLFRMLLTECAELEILYPDPAFFSGALRDWSNAMTPIWYKLIETTKYEYDPIENYNRMEEWTDNGNDTEDQNVTTTQLVSGTNGATSKIAAFDNGSLETRDSAESSGESTSAGTNTGTRKLGRNSTHSGRTHGNIGVTTTQAMIREERGVVRFNIYDEIISDFKARFCIMIY